MAGPDYSTSDDFGGGSGRYDPVAAEHEEAEREIQPSTASDFGALPSAATQEPGFWHGFGPGAIYRGAEEGLRKLSIGGGALERPLYALVSSPDFMARYDKTFADEKTRLAELRRRDEMAGTAAGVVGGVAGGVVEGVGAPVSEGMQRYRDVREQGGTRTSAALSGLATGAVAGVGLAAPGGSSVLGSAVSGGFRQATAGAVQRAIDPVLLSAGGSEELAKGERKWSTKDTAIDALLGALFGSMHGLSEMSRKGRERVTPKPQPEPDEVKIQNKIDGLRKVGDPGLNRILDGIEATRAIGQVDNKAMLTQLSDLEDRYPHAKPVAQHARDVLGRNPRAKDVVNRILGMEGADDLWKHRQLDLLEKPVKPQDAGPVPEPERPPARTSVYEQPQERYQKPKSSWEKIWNRVNAAVPPMSKEQDLLRNTRIAVEHGYMTPEEGQAALKALDEKYRSAWNVPSVNAKMEQFVPEGHTDRGVIEGLRDRHELMGMTWPQALQSINSILRKHARGEAGVEGEAPHTLQRQALQRGLDPHKLQDWKDAGLSPKRLEAKLQAWIDEHDVQEHPAPGKEGPGEPRVMDGELRRLLKEATRRGYDINEVDPGWMARGVDPTELKQYLTRWLEWKETDDARNQAMVERERLWDQYRAGEGLDTHPTLRAAIRAKVPSNNKARFMRWLERWTNRRQPAPPRDVSGRLIRQTPEEREALARERPATRYEHLEERPYVPGREPPVQVPPAATAPEAARPVEGVPEPTGTARPDGVQNARGLLDKLDRLAAQGKEGVVRAITRGIRTGRLDIDAAHAQADEALGPRDAWSRSIEPDRRAPLPAPQTTKYTVERPTRTYDPRKGFQYWRKKPKPPSPPAASGGVPPSPAEPPADPGIRAQIDKNLGEIRQGLKEAEDRIKDQMPKAKKGDWLSRALAKPEKWLFGLFGRTPQGTSLAEAREIAERVEKDLGKLKLVGEAREVEGLSRTATLLLDKGVPAEPLRIIADMYSGKEINATEARLLMNRLLLSLRHEPEARPSEARPAPEETGEAKRARELKEEQKGVRKPLTLQELLEAAKGAGPRQPLTPIEGAKPLGDLEALKEAAKAQEKEAREAYAKAVGGDPILMAAEALQYSLYKAGDRTSAAHQALAEAKVDPNDPVAYHKAVEARKAPLKAKDVERDEKLKKQMFQDILDNPDPKMGTITDFEDYDEMLDRLWAKYKSGKFEDEPALKGAKYAELTTDQKGDRARFETWIEHFIERESGLRKPGDDIVPASAPEEKPAGEPSAAQVSSEMRTAMRGLHGEALADAELGHVESVDAGYEATVKSSSWIHRQYERVFEHVRELLTTPGQTHSLHGLLDTIISAPVKAPYVKGLAKVLRAYVQDMPVEVKPLVIGHDGEVKPYTSGLFSYTVTQKLSREADSPGAKIQLATNVATPTQDRETVSHPVKILLHETVHAATARFMRWNPGHPLVQKLVRMQRDLMDDANRRFDAGEPNLGFPTTMIQSSRELPTYGFTEPAFAGHLATVDMKLWATAPRKAFNVFSNILKRIFGLKGEQADLLDDLLHTGRQIMKLEQRERMKDPLAYKADPGGPGYGAGDPSMRIPPAAKERLERLMNSSDGIMARKMWVTAIKKVAPEVKSDQAARAGGIIANAIGKLIQQTVAYAKGSEKRFKYWQFNHEKMLDFLDAMERGAEPFVTRGKRWWGPEDTRPAIDPEIAGMVKHYRTWLNNIWQNDQNKGIEYKYTDHYIPHMFKDSEAVAQWMYNFYKPKMWANPSFTRTRMFETIQQARRAGFELKTNNVEELMLMRQAASDKAHMQIDMLERLADAGLAMTKHSERDITGKYTRNKPIDWSERRSPAGVMYYVHNDAMNILHNAFDQPGLWGGKDIHDWAYRRWMTLKNYSVPVKLALSLFHPLHVATIDQAQYIAQAWKEVAQNGWDAKRIGEYARKAAFASLPWVGENNRRGWHLMKLWEMEEGKRGKVSDTDALALGYMADGGFIPVLSEIHKQNQWNTFERAVRERKYWKGVIAPWAALDGIQKQAFEKWIPSLKTAAYVSQAEQLMRMRPELALDTVERQKAMRNIAKSIDNRYGEMTYDTLFWDKYYKDFGTAMTLSMGWNLGFIREFGGAAGQGMRAATRLGDREAMRQLRSKGQLDKAYFGMTYTLLGLTYAGLMSYWIGGKKAEEMGPKDFFWPVVGHNEDGTEKRVSTMFYNREFGGLFEHVEKSGGWTSPEAIVSGLWDFVANKGTGVPGLISDIAQGKDEFGREIMDPNEDEITKFMQELNYVMMDYTPIGIKGTMEGNVGVAPLLGFSAAPKYVTESNTESAIRFAYQKYVSHKVTPYDRALQDRDIDKIRAAWKANDPSVYDMLDQMQSKYNLTDNDIDKVERRLDDPKTAYQNMFQRLGTEGSWQEQKRLLDKMSPEEREQYLEFSDAEHLRDEYEAPEETQ